MSGPWDKYAPVDDSGGRPWEKYGNAPAETAQEEPKSRLTDKPNAVATGYNKGLLRLAGLPVDTIANVIDLAKATVGAPVTALTGKTPDMLQIKPRSEVFGSGDYLINKAPGVMVNAANPEYEGGYLQAAGGGLNAVMNPQSRAQLANQAALGVISALSGKGAYDATGNNALAITASLLPGGAQAAATGATKYAVRGGEKGRRAMEQRIADLKAAGVTNPTMGLASGNPLIGGVENLLQNAPGAVTIMRNAREQAVNELNATTQRAAAAASGNRGVLESGTGIQSGIKAFNEAYKAKQNQLYGNLNKNIPNDAPTGIPNTQATLSRLNEDIPTMPELSKQFKNARIQAIEAALKKDMSNGIEQNPPNPTIQRDRLGMPLQVQAAPVPALPRDSIPFEAVKKTRTLVGNELADNSLLSGTPPSKWRPLYGALSDDMQAAATAAGPDATRTFNRATDYTRAGLQRLERLAPFADRLAPEQAFTTLANTLKENTSTFQAVKKSLPEGVRGQVAGTVIERLGKARNGVQNDVGDVWSPETFLTNWNAMSPKGKAELLSGFPNASAVRSDIDAVAKATSMMRENSKIWANPSGTAANAAARGTLGAVGIGGVGALTGLLNPAIPIAAAGGLLGTNLLARSLTNKNAVELMARRSLLAPQLPMAALSSGLLSTSPE